MSPVVHTGGTSRSNAEFAIVTPDEAVRHHTRQAYLVRLHESRSLEPNTPEHFYQHERFGEFRLSD